MVHTHENVAAHTGLALKLESEVATTNKGLQDRGNTKKYRRVVRSESLYMAHRKSREHMIHSV
ncbi:hypothetical protein CY34DRAFT_803258 [Suillus luteus UH-Slu-Lm8-n1]|uniref:Uncharacterized protein n=1 Tax=Suillus luteus UH-Slu-Lm8-n1 TaxID=930992 RepID=A0A0D0A1V5_9AGAM|nr:hypothetical protein CY34DRAFT_803258 [Suillus luteus UH-Slu-Lm8-n1]